MRGDCRNNNIYCGLAEERSWAEHLTSPYLSTKECPCRVYSDSIPLKQIIGQTRTTASVAFNYHHVYRLSFHHFEHFACVCGKVMVDLKNRSFNGKRKVIPSN